MKIEEGYMPFKGGKTYYRLVNPAGKKTPLLFLHGGPGSTYNYFEVFDHMALEDDRPLVMYDQIGCGKSFIDGDETLFNGEVRLEELKDLKKYLGLGKIHILGQSRGGMLALMYAIEEKDREVKSYILASTLSSARLWKKEQANRIAHMDKKYQEAIKRAIENENYEDLDYLKAVDIFMETYCGPKSREKGPECLTRPKKTGAKAYLLGRGPNEFTPTGNLKDFDYTERLSEIISPCLVTSGCRDLSSPYIAKTLYDGIKNSRRVLFQNSRHMAFIEEHEKYVKVLRDRLNEND